MKFEDYPFVPVLKKNLALAGFRRPTDIQFKTIPPVLKGEDVLAIAQTGTGKTAAFAIPILQQLIADRSAEPGVRCLVMAPTRELALQITDVFQSLAKGSRVKTVCVHGGVDQDPQIIRLAAGSDIVVATPGRMFDLVSQKHIELTGVKTLVIDEADHMLDPGFIRDIQQLVKMLPSKRQTLFFSATIDSHIKKLAYALVKDAIRIQISPKDPVSKNVDHSVAFIEMDDKRFFLERLVNEHPESRILVFVRTKVRAERVNEAMTRVGINALSIHGDRDQKERIDALKQFRDGKVKVLVATDVSARGIDIDNVEYVVNYDLPEQPENYVHRVGRTGRGKKRGIAVAFCSPSEKPLLEAIEEYTGNNIAILTLDRQDYMMTVDTSSEAKSDWKTLVRDAELEEERLRKKKKTKNKR